MQLEHTSHTLTFQFPQTLPHNMNIVNIQKHKFGILIRVF